jgi:hypothetical protein
MENRVYFVNYNTDNAEYYYIAGSRMLLVSLLRIALQNTSCPADASQLQALPLLAHRHQTYFEILRDTLEKHFTFNRSKLLDGMKVNNGRKFRVVVFGQKEHREGGQEIAEIGGLSLDEVFDPVR